MKKSPVLLSILIILFVIGPDAFAGDRRIIAYYHNQVSIVKIVSSARGWHPYNIKDEINMDDLTIDSLNGFLSYSANRKDGPYRLTSMIFWRKDDTFALIFSEYHYSYGGRTRIKYGNTSGTSFVQYERGNIFPDKYLEKFLSSAYDWNKFTALLKRNGFKGLEDFLSRRIVYNWAPRQKKVRISLDRDKLFHFGEFRKIYRRNSVLCDEVAKNIRYGSCYLNWDSEKEKFVLEKYTED